MFKKKKHPFEYINESNFDKIRECIVSGMNAQKTPKAIADELSRVAELPYDVAEAIVSNEVKGVLDG
jgi:hypothetical protein